MLSCILIHDNNKLRAKRAIKKQDYKVFLFDILKKYG